MKLLTHCEVYKVYTDWYCASGYDKRGVIVVEFGRTHQEALLAFIANCK